MNSAEDIAIKNTQLQEKGTELVTTAQALTIDSVPKYEKACIMLLDAKAGLKAVDEAFDADIARWHDGHKQALATKAKYAAPFKEIETILKPRIGNYLAEQERLRREAEAKAQQEAQLQEAMDAEALGDKAGSEAALNGHGVVSVHIPSTAPKVSGISQRENWRAEVTDLMTLVKAVASGSAPIELLQANMLVLNAQARALKTGFRYPGVKAVCEATVAAGRTTSSRI